MKGPEASWKAICTTSMKGPEPRPRKDWEEDLKEIRHPEKAGKRPRSRKSQDKSGKRPWERSRSLEKAQKRPRGPEEAGKRSRSKGWERGQRP